MKTVKKIIWTIAALFYSSLLMAQETSEIEMADEMRASGKIYVVVAVLALIFLGITIYLILLDRKIARLEREQDKQL